MAEAARAVGLDFVILTDHRTDDSPDSLWYVPARYEQGVLLVRGQEISLGSDVGRLLVFGLDTAVTRWDGGLEALARRLAESGATAIVAHSRSPRERDSWRPRDTPGIVGWEVFDLADIGRRRLAGPWVAYHLLALGASATIGRGDASLWRLYREGFAQPAVAAFDSLYGQRRLTALAGLDVHPKRRIAGRLFPPYAPFFGSLVNHVAVDAPLPPQADEATALLAAGLRGGGAYISFGNAADARGFTASLARSAVGPARVSLEGAVVAGEAVWESGLVVRAGFPDRRVERLLYRVVRDGAAANWVRGPELAWPVPAPGDYRVEVYRYTLRVGPLHWNLRPWIFANPLQVARPAP